MNVTRERNKFVRWLVKHNCHVVDRKTFRTVEEVIRQPITLDSDAIIIKPFGNFIPAVILFRDFIPIGCYKSIFEDYATELKTAGFPLVVVTETIVGENVIRACGVYEGKVLCLTFKQLYDIQVLNEYGIKTTRPLFFDRLHDLSKELLPC